MASEVSAPAGRDYRLIRVCQGGSPMNLSAPSQAVFWIAVVIVILGIIASFNVIPGITAWALWIVVLGFIVLAGGCLMRGT
jgi:hypothetical protein